ncbi:MAG: hypothetical protein R2939_18965 [Kofleriaceae bacterium]
MAGASSAALSSFDGALGLTAAAAEAPRPLGRAAAAPAQTMLAAPTAEARRAARPAAPLGAPRIDDDAPTSDAVFAAIAAARARPAASATAASTSTSASSAPVSSAPVVAAPPPVALAPAPAIDRALAATPRAPGAGLSAGLVASPAAGAARPAR